MENFTAWLENIFRTYDIKGIIAVSALIAWLLPKLIYFAFKLTFNTLLFIVNILGRDTIELWLKSKINKILARFMDGVQVNDIPRWLNKDQLVLRELHWEKGTMVLDVPSVVITINLPTFCYSVVKLKLRYLLSPARFQQKLDELLHNSVREVRIQEPAMSYSLPEKSLSQKTSLEQAKISLEQEDAIFTIYREAVKYYLHIILEHGLLQFSALGLHASLENVNIDIYNRATKLGQGQDDFLLNFILTGLYEGNNVSLANKSNSLTDYELVINHIFITSKLWQMLCTYCQGLRQLEFSEQTNIGVLKHIYIDYSFVASQQITALDCEYRLYKPKIKILSNFESAVSLEGRLGWNEHGLQLLDNFLLFQNGLRLHVPCIWNQGQLVLELPNVENFKQQYGVVWEQAKENAKNYREKITATLQDTVKNWR